MIITKVLETSVDLFSDDDIYTIDLPAMLKKKLNERYANKCFSSTLILEVIDIIRYSDVTMVDNRLDGGAYVDVEFRVRGIVYTKGEVLQGCTAVNVSSNGIIITHEHAVGMMTNDPTKKVFSIVKKDQLIPVVVTDSRYNVGKSQITITCKPYTPQAFSEVLYNINGGLSDKEKENIDLLIADLKSEEALHNKIKDSKSYEFFKNLIYPYKTTKKFNLSPIGSSFEASDVSACKDLRDGCITNPDASLVKFVAVSKKKITSHSDIVTVESSLYPALSDIINQRYNYLTTLRGFVETYDTAEKNQVMMAYWKVCMSLKE